jgi:hypothetical protein
MEEVRKANEAEFERRLKGEYMAAQQRLGQVVSGIVACFGVIFIAPSYSVSYLS